MSNEPNGTPEERLPDAFAEWRQLLRQPDAVPGRELAGKDAAWDKLFDRLNEKPRRRFLGYRLVAACILILLIPATRLFQHQPGNKDRLNSVSARLAIAEPVPVRPTAAPLANAPTAPRSEPTQPLTPSKPSRRARPQPGLAQPTRPEPAPPIIAAPPQLAITIPPPVPPAPQKPKKQWKVVDINELDPGRPRPHAMADNRQPTLLRLGLGIPNTTVNDNLRDNDTRLKIDLNTQNH